MLINKKKLQQNNSEKIKDYFEVLHRNEEKPLYLKRKLKEEANKSLKKKMQINKNKRTKKRKRN